MTNRQARKTGCRSDTLWGFGACVSLHAPSPGLQIETRYTAVSRQIPTHYHHGGVGGFLSCQHACGPHQPTAEGDASNNARMLTTLPPSLLLNKIPCPLSLLTAVPLLINTCAHTRFSTRSSIFF